MAATAQPDYYEVPGVQHDADEKTIRDAFRKLAQRYHPDRSKEPDASERLKEIAAAYAVLSDPAKRAADDADETPGVSAEDLFEGSPPASTIGRRCGCPVVACPAAAPRVGMASCLSSSVPGRTSGSSVAGPISGGPRRLPSPTRCLERRYAC